MNNSMKYTFTNLIMLAAVVLTGCSALPGYELSDQQIPEIRLPDIEVPRFEPPV